MVAALVSEEDEEPVTFDRRRYGASTSWSFDPLDGSSNIDVNVNVGTIFSILKRLPSDGDDLQASVLQPGLKQVAAGIRGVRAVYGAGVYDWKRGAQLYTRPNDRGVCADGGADADAASKGTYYSVNEANQLRSGQRAYRTYVDRLLRGQGRKVHTARDTLGRWWRTSIERCSRAAIFLYPPTKKQPGGKLRLLYEANPLAMIAEQAGGKASIVWRQGECWISNLREFTSGRRLWSEALERWRCSKRC